MAGEISILRVISDALAIPCCIIGFGHIYIRTEYYVHSMELDMNHD